jgi:prephenate dehydrogenase
VLCPSDASSERAVEEAAALARACGGEVVRMSAEEHDRAVAMSSHLPQVAASALAAGLVGSSDDVVRVSGPGLQDTTRIAASDPAMWIDVLSANATFLAPLADALAGELRTAADALAALAAHADDAGAREVLDSLLRRGNTGRARVPVKRGILDRDVLGVPVRVPDEPGRLARLLTVAAETGVNVEDVRVEHLSGRRTGVVELLVKAADAPRLRAALSAHGMEALG